MTLEDTTCNAIRESVQRDAYGKSVIGHVGECEPCLDVTVKALLAGRKDVAVAPGFVSRVLVKVSSSSRPAAPFRLRRALWPAIVVVCALTGAASLAHLSAFAQSWWGAAVLAAGGMETSLIIVWVLGWNRSAPVFHRADAAG